jgi:hypothetical protein
VTRGRFDGVCNIVRFNWPMFVVTAILVVSATAVAATVAAPAPRAALLIVAACLVGGTLVSLTASHLIYDRSDLYRFGWMARAVHGITPRRAIFCQTGFDECSATLGATLRDSSWTLLDHYDPAWMTEPSIQRARRRCPPAAGTRSAPFGAWPVHAQAADLVIGMLAVHELRRDAERVAWFAEARRVTSAEGRVIVVEHVRDLANILVFGPGAWHFHSVMEWRTSWERAHLRLRDTFRITTWVRVFVLEHA